MTKRKKKLLIIIIIVISIISAYALYLRIKLVHYWNTNPEPICNRAGGFWDGVKGCDNFCDKTGKYCPNKIIFGCWCGLDKCWDGKKCVNRIKSE